MNRHGRSGSAAGGLGNAKKPNTKAAAQRLANMMANQSGADDSDEEDDLFYEAAPSIGIGAGGRAARPRSPSVRTSVIDHPSQRRSLGTRASQPQSAENTDQESPKARSLGGNRAPQTFNYAEKPSSLSGIRASKPADYTEEQLPSSHSSVGSRAPQSVNNVEPQQQPSAGSRTPKSINYVGRPASPMASSRQSFNYAEQQPSSGRSNSSAKLSQPHLMDQSQSVRSSFSARSSQSPRSAEHVQAPLARSGSGGRTSHSIGSMEQPLSAKSSGSGRPGLGVKSVPMVPQSVPLKLKPSLSGIPGESPRKMLSIDMGSMKFRDSGHQNSASALQDEVDMLQEENESLLEKLRLAEVRFRESEMRTRELEKQVANLGEGVSMETRLLSRKEAELQEREAALKAVQQSFGGKGEEIVSLRMEAESAREEANSALDQLQDATREVKSLRIMTKRLMLTQEEMEEVVLKRCWLARHWSLCVDHGIHSDIAAARYDYWSYFAPRPVEVVLAAGQRAKDENSLAFSDLEERGNIENMLMVEKGLRELTSLKVESALAVAMAHRRRKSSTKSDELKLPIDGQLCTETFELSKQESDDVRFKQAWLMYFWRRAIYHGLEPEIAEERAQYWINQSTQQATSHEAVNVERGLLELRKLGIEAQLWQESRKMIDSEMYSNF